jgi:hypothetical protein
MGLMRDALRRGPAGLLVRVGSDDEGTRALSRHDDLEALPRGNDPAPANAARNFADRFVTYHEVARSPAGTIEGERVDVGAALRAAVGWARCPVALSTSPT